MNQEPINLSNDSASASPTIAMRADGRYGYLVRLIGKLDQMSPPEIEQLLAFASDVIPNGMDHAIDALMRRTGYQPQADDLSDQIERLAEVLVHEFGSYFATTDGSEGAVDLAIRVMRAQAKTISLDPDSYATAMAIPEAMIIGAARSLCASTNNANRTMLEPCGSCLRNAREMLTAAFASVEPQYTPGWIEGHRAGVAEDRIGDDRDDQDRYDTFHDAFVAYKRTAKALNDMPQSEYDILRKHDVQHDDIPAVKRLHEADSALYVAAGFAPTDRPKDRR